MYNTKQYSCYLIITLQRSEVNTIQEEAYISLGFFVVIAGSVERESRTVPPFNQNLL